MLGVLTYERIMSWAKHKCIKREGKHFSGRFTD